MRAAFAPILMLAACTPAAPPLYTVEQIVRHCEAVKGKTVRAAGYLATCAGYDCSLYADTSTGTASRIGIGGGAAFDRKAAAFQKSYVIITGRVVDEKHCTGAALDRAAGIEPTDIRAWTPSEGKLAKTQ
ncbi:hypothetical protein OF829_17175 [Sphingomonas sp. LB-2]|uniref:hypothetical protein n=1 Tax=Sphingomonas caeni TaxID=2984949 RepID=UPI00222E7C5A|nr:hypothetical protein [Sphingomonas caeni]MCW3848973.1 hypothetical protein [Sphingomonas caeni]